MTLERHPAVEFKGILVKKENHSSSSLVRSQRDYQSQIEVILNAQIVREVVTQYLPLMNIIDKRQAGKIKFTASSLLFVVSLSYICGYRSASSIGRFWSMNRTFLKAAIPHFPDLFVSHDTIKRTIENVIFEQYPAFLDCFTLSLLYEALNEQHLLDTLHEAHRPLFNKVLAERNEKERLHQQAQQLAQQQALQQAQHLALQQAQQAQQQLAQAQLAQAQLAQAQQIHVPTSPQAKQDNTSQHQGATASAIASSHPSATTLNGVSSPSVSLQGASLLAPSSLANTNDHLQNVPLQALLQKHSNHGRHNTSSYTTTPADSTAITSNNSAVSAEPSEDRALVSSHAFGSGQTPNIASDTNDAQRSINIRGFYNSRDYTNHTHNSTDEELARRKPYQIVVYGCSSRLNNISQDELNQRKHRESILTLLRRYDFQDSAALVRFTIGGLNSAQPSIYNRI